MKYIDEFRNGDYAAEVARRIHAEADPERRYRFMEFCGGHTHTLFRYGIPDLLPANVKMIHGPGCPVCVLPMARIDAAIELAVRHQVVLCSYGDMLRVPGAHRTSLQKAKSQGADVRMLYSPADALRIALENPQRQVVFFAIGFETTTPPTAAVLLKAQELKLRNFSVFCNHVLTPPAITGILEPAQQAGERIIEGLVGPGHVSVITGGGAYDSLARRYRTPIVIAGFEPLDILHSILLLVRQCNAGRYDVENQYSRAVTASGNAKAQSMAARTMTLRDSFEWRGLGWMPHSALRIRPEFADYDAERRFELSPSEARENKACECPAVLRGAKAPTDCKLFATVCTPDNPIGACMVSSEGACAAHYSYGHTR
ncbi:hydrogenase expression/formation protein HypD [Hahella chejuensis KCTC 2396]|uniref:Hydrogenase maturation factor n=1 Tax=Hahella chejuensis (strain KCTC 2396) TaxID=349521 RepID=Q2SQT0_HAHCH|nr:hydrogenase formation protein HypD [Hahella chejuensis]ABC26994.1 hydrogenase expression/formation protein HypD [Hahella chejuensis KCTC 2396]